MSVTGYSKRKRILSGERLVEGRRKNCKKENSRGKRRRGGGRGGRAATIVEQGQEIQFHP